MARPRRTVAVDHAAQAAAEMVFLTPKALAARWHTTTKTLANRRYLGTGPTFVKTGGFVLYRLSSIEAYEATNERGAA